MQKPVPPSQILALTLPFLGTGESYASLECQFRISKILLSNMIPYTCELIFSLLKEEHMPCPQAEWSQKRFLSNLKKGGSFQTVLVQEMANTSALSAHRIVTHNTSITKATLAFVGPRYEFLFDDAGCEGSASDGGVFRCTKLWKALKENSVYLPPAKPLPSRDQFYKDDVDLNIEHYFVCDDAFPLSMNLMKPYSKSRLTDEKRIFNYLLSRARRVSENAFGILAARFRVLHTMMCLDPRKARTVVLACCTLHNMLLSKSSQSYCPSGSIDYEDENGKVIPGS